MVLRGLLASIAFLVIIPSILLFTASAASAHSKLSEITPRDQSVLMAQPSKITIKFDKAIYGVGKTVSIFTGTGTEINLQAVKFIGSSTVVAEPAENLANGTYIVVWVVVSDDGHPVKGSSVFTVGTPSPIDENFLYSVTSDASFAFWEFIGSIGRFLSYVGLFVALGAALSAIIGDDRLFTKRLALFGFSTTTVGVLAVFVSQLIMLTGIRLGYIERFAIIWDLLLSRVAISGILRIFAAFLALTATRSEQRSRYVVYAFAIISGSISFTILSHASTSKNFWSLPYSFLHVSAVGIWVAALVTALRPTEEVMQKVSKTAVIAAPFGFLFGLTLASTLKKGIGNIFLGQWGQFLAIKVVLASLALLLGAVHRFLILPRLSTERGMKISRLITKLELLFIALVLAVTVALSSTSPGGTTINKAKMNSEQVFANVVINDYRLNLAVRDLPDNERRIDLYAFYASGAAAQDVVSVEFLFQHFDAAGMAEVGQVQHSAQKVNPGYWSWSGTEMVKTGRWEIVIVLKNSAGDTFTSEKLSFAA